MLCILKNLDNIRLTGRLLTPIVPLHYTDNRLPYAAVKCLGSSLVFIFGAMECAFVDVHTGEEKLHTGEEKLHLQCNVSSKHCYLSSDSKEPEDK